MKKENLKLIAAFIIFSIVLASSQLAFACNPGEKVEVIWKGKWYPATVIKASGSKCFIHYDGYNNSWDEWVGPNRIRYLNRYVPGAAVQVYWKGRWYNAHVLSTGGNKYYIHYDGYNNSWDEWVGSNRIRSR